MRMVRFAVAACAMLAGQQAFAQALALAPETARFAAEAKRAVMKKAPVKATAPKAPAPVSAPPAEVAQAETPVPAVAPVAPGERKVRVIPLYNTPRID